MAKSESTSMNVSALKLKDPFLKEILDTAAHVALYNYNPDLQNWEKTEVEGAFFVYSRTTEPQYNAFIMNRLNTTNHTEHIDEHVDLQLHEPFILYKNAKGIIHGIWFYDREECGRIAALIEKLSNEIAKNKKVEGHFHNNSTHPSEEQTNRRVMDFFAKAGGKAPMGRPPPPMTFVNMNEVNPLVQRLLSTSNAVQTVAEIEKRQKVLGVTSGEERGGGGHQHHPGPSSGAIPIQRQMSEPQPVKSLENGLSYLRMSSDSPTQTPTSSSIPTQHFFNSSLRQASSPNTNNETPLEVSVLERAVIDTPSKPALLPPVMFTSNLHQPEDNALSLFPNPQPGPEPTVGLQTPNSYQPPGGVTVGANPALSPLTKPQLLQAVNYLLKNDADFVTKLHEAYVKSFVDMVS